MSDRASAGVAAQTAGQVAAKTRPKQPHGDRAPGNPSPSDLAPGDDEGGESVFDSIRSYLFGLGLAGLLTAMSFALSYTHLVYGPTIWVALIVFAIAQMGIHLVFFLHLTTAPDNLNNSMALAFGVLIVLLLIGGTIWIMSHMNGNMMPMNGMPSMGP